MYHNRKIGFFQRSLYGQEENEKFQRLHAHRLTEKQGVPLQFVGLDHRSYRVIQQNQTLRNCAFRSLERIQTP
eukprot:g83096.t1